MLDWLPHNERGHVHVGSARHLATARASVPMTVVEAPGGPVTPLVYSLIVLPYAEAVSAANPRVDGLSLVRAWYGYLYVTTDDVALPEPGTYRCPAVDFEHATPAELISIARATSQHPRVNATSLGAAVADLLGGDGGECIRCCCAAIAELGRRFAEDRLLDTPESIMMVNDDEFDGFAADPAMYSEAIRARAALFADVAEHQPPLLLDSKAPSFARWVKRDRSG